MNDHEWGGWDDDPEQAGTADHGDGFAEPDFGAAPFSDTGPGDTGPDYAGLDYGGLDYGGLDDTGLDGDPPGGEDLADPSADGPDPPIGYGDALTDEPFDGGEPETGSPDGGGEPDTEFPGGGEPDTGAPEQDDAGLGATDAPVGADPDLDPHSDDAGWHESTFPAALDPGTAPEPVDGFPWTDVAALGDGVAVLPDPVTEALGAPEAGDLLAYAGEDVAAGGASWAALAASPDPATSALARWWAPGT